MTIILSDRQFIGIIGGIIFSIYIIILIYIKLFPFEKTEKTEKEDINDEIIKLKDNLLYERQRVIRKIDSELEDCITIDDFKKLRKFVQKQIEEESDAFWKY